MNKKSHPSAISMKNQETTPNFDSHHDAQKRKWPYNEPNSFTTYSNDDSTVAKKCITNTAFDYYQPTQQYQIIAAADGQDHRIQQQCDTTQLIDTMELNENIEYVNILYDDDLLTSIQAPSATETNYINFEPNWTNADILDLDQRSYFYDTTHITDLNGQLLQQTTSQSMSIVTEQQQNVQSSSHPTLNQSQTLHQNVTEYEVLQNVFIETGNGQENAPSNVCK